MTITIFFSLLLTFLITQGTTESISFGVFYGDNEIGHISATRTIQENSVRYDVKSDVEYNSWLYDYQRNTYLIAVFKAGELWKAQNKVTEDGDLKEYRTTKKLDNSYLCKSQSEEDFILDEQIEMSCGALYFVEPVGLKKIFSEGQQGMCKIGKKGSHSYQLTFPNGETNTYTYRNGKLVEVEVPRRWFTVKFKRK